MKKLMVVALALSVAAPAFAKTHKDAYTISCNTLWQGIRDTLRNSGKYGIISINSEEMTASYNIGGSLTGKRINTVLLNPVGTGCEMQIQTAFSGLVNNDAADFKKRVDESLVKLRKAQSDPEGKAAPAENQSSPQPR